MTKSIETEETLVGEAKPSSHNEKKAANIDPNSPPTIAEDLKILDAKFVPECATVMAQAFRNSPGYNFIFQGTPESRVSKLEWLFIKNLHLVIRQCPTALRGILNDEDQVVCCFLWIPSPLQDSSWWDLFRGGLWEVPVRFGWGTFNRLLRTLDLVKSNEETMKSEAVTPFVSLQRMVVHPAYQGRGLGTMALRSVMDQAEGKEIRLDTQLERNVRFYKRLGFEVVHEDDYFQDDAEFQFHSWTMVRSATQPNHDGS